MLFYICRERLLKNIFKIRRYRSYNFASLIENPNTYHGYAQLYRNRNLLFRPHCRQLDYVTPYKEFGRYVHRLTQFFLVAFWYVDVHDHILGKHICSMGRRCLSLRYGSCLDRQPCRHSLYYSREMVCREVALIKDKFTWRFLSRTIR